MKPRQLVQGICFLAIVIVLLLCSTYIVRTNGEVKDRFTGFYAESKDTIDVIMIGASPIATSFSPGSIWGETGITSYPLSTNSQNPKAIKYLLEEAYKYQKPELVVIELRMFTEDEKKIAEDSAHIREVTDNMKLSFNRIRAINALVEQPEERYTYYFDIIKFHSNWKMFFFPEELKKFNYVEPSLDKGFEFSEEIMPLEPPTDIDMQGVCSTTSGHTETLNELLSYLHEHNQQALFVVTPKYLSNEYQGMMNYMGDIIEENGFQFLNMNEYYKEMEFDFHTDLMDGAHTNILGAKKCSDFLSSYLTTNYSIQDKRGQLDFATWDEANTRFENQYETIKKQAEQQ